MSGLAHHRSSSTFLEEYAGVVGFYNYLEQSRKWMPPYLGKSVPFLGRNLSYKREAYEQERKRLNGSLTEHANDNGAAVSGSPVAERQRRSTAGQAGVHDGDDHWSSMRTSGHSRTSVIYKLRYNEGLQECVQRRPDFQCAWCEMSCGNIDGLMNHLQDCHDRFTYTQVSLTTPEIYVSVKQKCEERMHVFDNFSYVSTRKGGPEQKENNHSWLESMDEEDADAEREDYEEMEEEEEEAVRRKRKPKEPPPLKIQPKEKKRPVQKHKDKVVGKGFNVREYFRSQTCLKIDSDDMDYDSDDDVDDEWKIKREEELMEEFTDVTNKEKLFMKLWNRFVHRHGILADFQIPEACRVFATHHARELIERDLRDEMLFHMFALWDFNLIHKDQIMSIISIVDALLDAEKDAGCASHTERAEASEEAGKQHRDKASAKSSDKSTDEVQANGEAEQGSVKLLERGKGIGKSADEAMANTEEGTEKKEIGKETAHRGVKVEESNETTSTSEAIANKETGHRTAKASEKVKGKATNRSTLLAASQSSSSSSSSSVHGKATQSASKPAAAGGRDQDIIMIDDDEDVDSIACQEKGGGSCSAGGGDTVGSMRGDKAISSSNGGANSSSTSSKQGDKQESSSSKQSGKAETSNSTNSKQGGKQESSNSTGGRPLASNSTSSKQSGKQESPNSTSSTQGGKSESPRESTTSSSSSSARSRTMSGPKQGKKKS